MTSLRILVAALVLSLLAACTGGSPTGHSGEVDVAVRTQALGASSAVAAVWVQLTPSSGGSPIQGWTTNTANGWSVVFGQVPVGTYAIYAKAVDGAQNILFATPTPYPGGPVLVTAEQRTQVTLVLQATAPPAPATHGAPYVISLYASQAQVDDTTTVLLDASAADTDPLETLAFSWTASGGSFGAVESGATTTHTTWTPPGDGAFSVTVTVTDGHGSAASLSVTIDVSPAGGAGSVAIGVTLNSAPVVTGVTSGDAEGSVGQPVSLVASATDADGNPLSFAWSSDCAGSFDPPAFSQNAGVTQSTTAFTASASPVSGVCSIRVEASDGRGGIGAGSLLVSFAPPVVGQGPSLYIVASSGDLQPNDVLDLVATPSDGAPHAGWSYTWADGLAGVAAGTFAPVTAGHASHEHYTHADCVLLGGGDQTIDVAVTAVDAATGASGSASLAVVVHCPAATYYTTKTPYVPLEDASAYEAPPAGFAPVFTQIVARHGARGLSGLKYDAAAYAMWQKAAADGALTALGASLGPDIMTFMRANALLGVGVPGISAPGYGNLTLTGIQEQRDLASRLLARLPDYFAQVAASGTTASPRSIVVVSSGVDRAVDSAAFFSGEIAATSSALGALLVQPPAPAGYPAGAPILQPAGTNRFLLYFHKLAPKTDLVTDPADPYFTTYQDSLAFQAYASDANLLAKVNSVLADPTATAAARIVLETAFTDDFIGKIDDGTYSFANTGTFSFTSDDGSFSTTLTGDGKTTIHSLTDAAETLYNLYVVAPAMTQEVGVDFTPYIPATQAQELAYLQDAEDFYQMGPGIAEANPVTYKMAQVLEDDFFTEVDAIAAGDLSHGAKLRFTHAEIMCPFASILGLKGIFAPVPLAQTYAYATNPWRGEIVSPMAANVQWDVYEDASGDIALRMLYNEREIDFKADCDQARHAAGSHFYDYSKLKACYGRP
ncbi:MAG TPA: hypothetical protein VGM06_03380 [Polyangiaceae bacterium]